MLVGRSWRRIGGHWGGGVQLLVTVEYLSQTSWVQLSAPAASTPLPAMTGFTFSPGGGGRGYQGSIGNAIIAIPSQIMQS